MSGALPVDTVVAVLGAGTMGAGIARVAAEAGHTVRLFDTNQEVIDSALDDIRRRLDGSVAKGRRSAEEAAAIVGRIVRAGALGDVADAGLVVEAIVEDLAVKRRVFADLEDLVAPEAILATNTSSLSVTAIGGALRDPGRLVGMHFFNPAPVLPLVEIVVGADTAPDVAAAAHATAAAWGKTPVRCASTPGFIVNRVARPFYSESLRILDEGIADIATIDAIVTGSGGFRMGPFTLMDLVGLDVNLAVSKSVYAQTFNDSRFAPHVRQQAKVDAGHLGRKTGRGWYDHSAAAAHPEPTTLAPGPAPDAVTVAGDPHLDPLAARLEAAGVSVRRAEDDPGWAVAVGDVEVWVTDGRPAELMAGEQALRNPILVDLVLDWSTATGVAVAAPRRVAAGSLATAAGLFQAVGLSVSRVADAPGMVLARIISQLVSVAADAATAGVATPDDIDTAMRLGTNYPGGPFEWVEAIGVVPFATIIDHLRAFYGEDRYRMAAAVRRAAYTRTSLRTQAARRI